MLSQRRTPRQHGPGSQPTAGLTHGLCLLLDGYELAQGAAEDPWPFALEMARLKSVGLTHSLLRWLVREGHVEQAEETTAPGDRQRTFRPIAKYALPERACFLLTAAGAVYARDGCPIRRERPWIQGPTLRPVWDQQRRQLRLLGKVAKRFSQPAASQELILTAFEEDGWPLSIDDPLPPGPGKAAKKRLHKTIGNLNRGLRLLRFHGGGTGQTICWRLAEDSPSEGTARAERGQSEGRAKAESAFPAGQAAGTMG